MPHRWKPAVEIYRFPVGIQASGFSLMSKPVGVGRGLAKDEGIQEERGRGLG